MILIDYSGVAHGAYFAIPGAKVDEGFIRHLILNSIRMYNHKYKATYGKMIIACDGGGKKVWRKEYFPLYKAGRRKEPAEGEKPGVDWNEFYRIIGMVKDEIAANFPYAVFTSPGAEADDIIATVVESTQEFGQCEPVLIVSSDKDFVQLQKYKNVKQFSPILKKFMVEKDPHGTLRNHILTGDGSDGIPNILSDDDTHVDENKRQNPLTKKRKEPLLGVPEDHVESLLTATEYRNYIRNKTLIDLSMIPSSVKESIRTSWAEAELARPKNNSKIFNYLVTSRCSNLIACSSEFFQ